MNDPYQQTAPKQTNTGSPAAMKPLTFFLITFLIAQLIGTILYGIYLQMKLDKVEDDMSLTEDYLFIRKLKKCMNGDEERTFLNCKEIVVRFQKLLLEVTAVKTTDSGDHSMLKDDMKIPIAAHLYGQQSTGPKTVYVGRKVQLGVYNANSSNSSKCETHCILSGVTRRRLLTDLKGRLALEWAKVGYSTVSHLTSEKDTLKVERPGLYYVYSQVTFCINGSSTSAAPFVHYMYLKHPHETDKLLLRGTSAHNVLRTSDCTQQSIYLGGIFDFQKGESILVNVTDSTRVRYMAGYTYFGMFMV